MKLIISSAIIEELQALAREAGRYEICGLLFGDRHGHVTDYRMTHNVADNPARHFEIDPRDLIAAEREARNGAIHIVGYFHSHPSGRVEPSRTDAQSAAADGRIWLILNGKEAAAWQAVDHGEIFDRFNPIQIECPLD